MNDSIAICVKNVSKKFRVYEDKAHTIKERVINFQRNRRKEHTVLSDISFDIKKGEAVGLIGQNGCGKSTTLKLLTKIIYPDSGTVVVNGRVSSLLELGAGFHPDMSGRENIYTNASIFGLSKREIDERIDQIIDFSELEEFIDSPVRTYSSGMYMRLAFSVAINVNADILLIDEILAVGDVNFQKKCLDRIKEIKKSGTTIVLVSHSMNQIEDVCDNAIWLEDGTIKREGCVHDVISDYRDQMEEIRISRIRGNTDDITKLANASFSKLTIRGGTGKVRFTNIKLLDRNGVQQSVFNCFDDIEVLADYENCENVKEGIVSISVARDDGVLCFATSSVMAGKGLISFNKNGNVSVGIKCNNLLNGRYLINLGICSADGEVYDDLQRVKYFEINSSKTEDGIIYFDTEWDY